MEVINYLNAATTDSREDTLEELKDHLGIKYSINPDYPELVVLNYCQITSPKFHPIVTECRSLVVECVKMGEWKVVSRSFDRFYNYGETDLAVNVKYMKAFEKMDGSLIGIFYYPKYGWLYRTRSMIMPDCKIGALENTWSQLIYSVTCHVNFSMLNKEVTYICEVTSPYNHIVKSYSSCEITLLSARNVSGVYVDAWDEDLGFKHPRSYTFDSIEECQEAAAALPDLEEGYVLYKDNEPVCKVKSPAYVKAHHVKGEGIITPIKAIDMISANELDEYLTIFPSDAFKFGPYVRAFYLLIAEAEYVWTMHRTINDGKEFAEKVSKYRSSGLVFNKRHRDASFSSSIKSMTKNAKVSLIKSFME